MNCPYCQFPSCYNSGFQVECANPKCKHYTVKQCIVYVDEHIKKELNKLALSNFKESPELLPSVFTYSHPTPTTLAVSWSLPEDSTKVISRYYHF